MIFSIFLRKFYIFHIYLYLSQTLNDLFKSLQSVYEKEPVKIDEYASILFDQALLSGGFSIDDPVDFSNKITKLMIEASK